MSNYNNIEIIDKLSKIVHFAQQNGLKIDKYNSVKTLLNFPDLPIDRIEYYGYSTCRICGKQDNGNSDIILRHQRIQFIFPDGYLHYIETHGVEPTIKLVDFIKSTKLQEIPDIDEQLVSLVNIRKHFQGLTRFQYSS